VHEVLFPRKQPLEPAFTGEFVGMTREDVDLATLEQTQWKLLNLRKLRSRNAGRFKSQHDELAASFNKLPPPRETPA
jgi:hypothetical protein